MANRYYGHIWNGYEIPGASQSADGAQDTVYVAKNGKVYHEDRECIHLKVSVQSAPIQEIDYCRNESGSKYTLCQKCNGEEIQDMVYITEDGRHYHYNRECSGLKRTVYSMLRAEAQGYRPCKSCAAVH